MNFRSIWALLGDTRGWHRLRWKFDDDFLSDEVEHRTGIRFFTDCGGIRFRIGEEVVYEPNLLAWLVIGFRVRRLARSLTRIPHPESPKAGA